MGKLTLTFVKNPFDPLNSREIKVIDEGMSVNEIVKEYYPVVYEGYDIAISLDGNIVSSENKLDIIPKAGTSLAICAVPQGGDGKNPLAVVAMIALMVVAVVTVQPELAGYGASIGMGTTAATAFAAVGTAAFMTLGGMLVNSIFPASMPDMSMGDINSSATYSWNPGVNALYEGGALPEIFGTHRVTPPLISHFIETVGNKQYLNLLFAVAGHQVDSISDVRINEVESTNFLGITVDTRLGNIFQKVIPFFGDSRYDHPVGAKLQNPVAVNITGIDGDGYTLTITSVGHGFYTGQYVDIAGVGGVNNINGYSFQISNVTDNSFDISWADNGYNEMTGTYSGGGTATNGWIVRTTDGDVLDGIGIGIVLPRGLFYANDNGGLSPQTIKIYVEYRAAGTYDPWVRFQGYNTVPTVITDYRWSGGYWGTAEDNWTPVWIELEMGSSNPTEHTEGDSYQTDLWVVDDVYGGVQRFVGSWHWVSIGNTIRTVGSVQYDYVEITGSQTEPLRQVFYKDGLTQQQYEVRMRLVEALPSGSRYGNEVQFEYIQEITYDAFEYPGTALLGIRALATDQISGGMPKVDCLVTRSTVPVLVPDMITLNEEDSEDFSSLPDGVLSSGWTLCSGDAVNYALQVFRGVLMGTVENEYNIMTRDGSFSDDQYSSITLFISGDPTDLDVGVGVRMQTGSVPDRGYIMEIWYDTAITVNVGLYVVSESGWETLLETTIPMPINGDVFSLVVRGSTLTVLKNGQNLDISVVDNTFSSGSPAVLIYARSLPAIDLTKDIFTANAYWEYWMNELWMEDPDHPDDPNYYTFITWSVSSYGHSDSSNSFANNYFYQSVYDTLINGNTSSYDSLYPGNPSGKDVWNIPGVWQVTHINGGATTISRVDNVRSKVHISRCYYRDGNRGASIFDSTLMLTSSQTIPQDSIGISAWGGGSPSLSEGYVLKSASNPAWVSYHLLHRALPIEATPYVPPVV